MLKTVEHYPAEGMSFKSLGDQSEVSAASVVSVTGQTNSCDLSPRVGPLLAGIKEVIDDLDSASNNFGVLDFSAFNTDDTDKEVLFKWRDIVIGFLDVRDDLEFLVNKIRSVDISLVSKDV
ncbi:hypothetical protein [Xylella fastidiosa]|uniref:Uncharacterized protein n=1 Tax=Xylella fastidiosa subsp. sandyi Ann-1 TaxID=155920 RepID=A0A060H3X3_XYLFS|nr:hypothetical protein [Xylella fastidiosa]AIC11454.1 hypothetical protein D934_09380 [Xylella fastidiosa subsp. sandyi Ann-1]UIX80478.1 hypothetical protein LZ756_08115 [Xylella fastidiosa subsp. sandyi]